MSTDTLNIPAKAISTTGSNGTHTIKNYIGGKWVESKASATLPVMNPSIGKQIASVPLSTAQDVDDAVRAAQAAFPSWSATPIKERQGTREINLGFADKETCTKEARRGLTCRCTSIRY